MIDYGRPSEGNDNDIEGNIAVDSIGRVFISMSLNNISIRWRLEITKDSYFLSLENKTFSGLSMPDGSFVSIGKRSDTVEITDCVGARVEAIDLLRNTPEYKNCFTEADYKCIKALVSEAWVAPRIAKNRIDYLIEEHENNR